VDLANDLFVGQEEVAKIHGVRVTDDWHEQITRAVGAQYVHGETQAHVFVTNDAGGPLGVNGIDERGVH